jgi:hypothetical protein
MTSSWIWVMVLGQACIAIFTMSVNLITAQRRQQRGVEKDARRLRLLFIAELEILRENFMNNIDAIYQDENIVISSRAIISIYRGNVGRLISLHDNEIPAVVAAYAFCENIEAFLSAHGKPNGQSSYILGKERPTHQLVALYNKGAELVDRALTAMRDVNGGTRLQSAAEPVIVARARRDLASAARVG